MNKLEIKKIYNDYLYTEDNWDEENKVHFAKLALTQLSDADRIIWVLYTDLQSSRKVGKILGVSHNIVLREVHRIRAEILEHYNNILAKYKNDII